MASGVTETDLYQPVKVLLEGQGYEVKSEINSADIVALRGEEPAVVVEMKTAFSLALVHQAIDRLKLTDLVYVAIPEWNGRRGWKSFTANRTLCRRLGLGVITVNTDSGTATVHLDPGPYTPRKAKSKQSRMLREFQHRVGDPNKGGTTRVKLVTAYRQDALRCLNILHHEGPTKASEVAQKTNVERARTIMADDHYGWFERVSRGVYSVTPKGVEAIQEYSKELKALS